MDTNEWIWVFGGLIATGLVVSAMSRRQSRLTEVLKDFVKRTQDKQSQKLEKESNAESP